MSEHELWNELGNLYFLSGAYDQAALAYQRAIQLEAGFGRPYSNLALTYVQQGKYDEAIALYRRSIELLDETKERAVSWNRLGDVYRHLKDYSKAVIAFQEADELDPQTAAQLPDAPGVEGPSAQLPRSVLEASVSSPELAPEASLPAEAEEAFVDSSSDRATVTALEENQATSWSSVDPSQFQQNVSQSPAPGSLTTWGEAGFDDDDLDMRWALEPETEVFFPDPDEDDLATWLPLPSEDPPDEIENAVHPETIHQSRPVEADVKSSAYYQEAEAPDTMTLTASLNDAYPTRDARSPSDTLPLGKTGNRLAPDEQDIDLALEEPPAEQLALLSRQEMEPADVVQPKAQVTRPSPAQATAELDATEDTSEPQRDPEEAHEIEEGIEKFKRVVQLNNRNAHAWDALGTLYKSAGLYKDAILAYQQAITNDPSRSLYHHHLGLVYACEGRDEDAIAAFQRVIEIDPDYSLAHATLGGYYRKMGLEELAQKHIGKAMKNIFDSENEYNRACLEAICGNADQAIELLGVALKNKQTYVDWILRDPDLDFIRQDPRFKQLISEYSR